MVRIVIDRDRCTGLGMCEAEAAELFEVQDDGSLAILNDHPSPEQRAEAEAACLACPTEALSLIED
ncbi:MAG TPA: ferredoxin [Pseudonocardia sp.]|jgi:ferredoxin|uniref:ferredoxin n=1 Tax=Pseudonocardia sp. TaxID=60912 RepID=UPI002CF4404E|nr:ferredoxin [Pseudonocardia sp.]HTF51399.1 ferredoxin [Pseudonocardia sp.]